MSQGAEFGDDFRLLERMNMAVASHDPDHPGSLIGRLDSPRFTKRAGLEAFQELVAGQNPLIHLRRHRCRQGPFEDTLLGLPHFGLVGHWRQGGGWHAPYRVKSWPAAKPGKVLHG